ncbi:MAG: tetratricopeptide repeat protein [Candidatus Hydrogenedentes bacterium]|nr:tetratricopeptide repeat protein [Candidatus Hydrogenedentota bacterium]
MAHRDEKCPNCGSVVSEGDIICIACGTNLLTGQRILEEKHKAIDSPPRNYRGLIIGFLSLLLLAALIGAGIWVAMQDPKREAMRHYSAGNPLDGINVLREFVESGAEDPEAYLLLGKLYLDTQRFAEAADAFDRANELNPQDADAGLMAVYAATQEQGQAGRNRQIAVLHRVVEKHPQHEQAQMLLALALGANKDYSGEIEALQKVIELGDASGKARFQRGIAQGLLGDYEAAGASLQEALSANAGNGDIEAMQGILANLKGEADLAIAKLQQAIGKGTALQYDMQAHLGLIHMTRGEFNKALPLLRPPSGQDVSPAIRFFYGVCLQTLNLDQEAAEVFEPLAAKEGPYSTDAAIQMAMIAMNQSNLSQAQEYLRRATQISGGTAKMHTLQGQIAMMQGDLEAAQQAFRSAIAADDTYPAAHLENGLLYISRGLLAEGLAELERYMALAGETADNTSLGQIELLVIQLRQTVERESGGSTVSPTGATGEIGV